MLENSHPITPTNEVLVVEYLAKPTIESTKSAKSRNTATAKPDLIGAKFGADPVSSNVIGLISSLVISGALKVGSIPLPKMSQTRW